MTTTRIPAARRDTSPTLAAARLLPAALLLAACGSTRGDAPPETRKVDQVETFFGTEVADPYRWLEADVRESAEVAAWAKAENAAARRFLDGIEERDAIRARLEELWDYEKRSAPERHGEFLYAWSNPGLLPQSRLVRARELGGADEVVLDPNTFSDDGTVAFSGGAFTRDGSRLAYGTSASGSDWKSWRVLDLATLTDLDDRIEGIKYGDVSWVPDGSGFFYAAYEVPEEGVYTQVSTDQKVWFHELGTPQSEDLFIHARPDHPNWSFGPVASDDGRWLVLGIWEAGSKNLVHVFDLEHPSPTPIPLVDAFTASYEYVGTAGDGALLFLTNQDAPTGRVLAVDASATPPVWREVVPARDWRLEGADEVGGQLLCTYLADATTRVVRYGLDGAEIGEVELPGLGSASGFSGDHDASDLFFTYSSFATPPSTYRLDLASGATELVDRADVAIDPDDFVVEQVFYTSKDGTKVPMFVCRAKDVEPNGDVPTLLYGYGGFDISLTPGFSVSRLVWMEMGGVFAQANLRGGGEYGEAWHRAGTRTNKQNVFDDFVAAGEWLVSNGWTEPSRLAIEGGSNGGLLVGACLVQRPDLFGACIPHVGVMDMLRFQLFTAGKYWVDDYGSVDVEDEFRALYAYSPYHNLQPGTEYPATLILTADTDDRVVPAHSFKFAARMQECQAGDEPVLLRVESSAGHGAGKPTAKRIDEAADVWAFLVEELDFEPRL
ncbi:MAG: prolyl oligopeptidase family serine peptidase [Planctomycetota bacterium]